MPSIALSHSLAAELLSTFIGAVKSPDTCMVQQLRRRTLGVDKMDHRLVLEDIHFLNARYLVHS